MKSNSLFYILFLSFSCAFAQKDSYDSGAPLLPEQEAYDITFYDLDLFINPTQQMISGSNCITARIVEPLSFLVLDFEPRYTIDSVLVWRDGASTGSTFARDGSLIWIDLKTEKAKGVYVKVQIFYHGQPRVAPNPPWSGGVESLTLFLIRTELDLSATCLKSQGF